MAKLTLKDVLNTTLSRTKLYIDTELAKKANSSHGTHVTWSTTTPKANGTATIGSETKVARGDHVHPLQTTVSGNAGTATKFASAQSVTLTGDVTGSASSQAGWSVATTLKNSGVTAGNYGPSANASPAHNGTFSVPYITVDAKGRVTSAATRTITLPTDNNTWRGVQNNLTSTATDQSLSAAQGKVLQDNKADKTLLGEDLSNKTMSLNNLNLSSGSPKFKVYYCPTDGGGSNITGRPNDNSKQAFNLVIESLRWASTTDYITKQTYTQGAQKAIYVRYCTNGTWTAWEKIYTSGQKPTAANIGAAAASHTHNYAGSSSAGGAANSVKTNLAIKLNGGSTEGTNLFTFNGSTAKTVNITPSAIGAAASSHGTHLTLGTGSGNAYYGDKGNTAYTHSQAAHAPSNAQKNSDITKAEIEAKLTGAITSHTHSYANKFLSRDEYTQITVNGDANKYYPVLLSTSNVSSYPTITVSISRTYSWAAPSTWNTSTHKGGLTFTLEWNCSKYWDGNGTGSSNACYVTQFLESYCTMVAGLSSSTSGIVVWLRGGGALYQINSSIGKAVTAEVKLEGFTDSASQTFSARDYNATTVNNEIKKRWVNRSTSGVYDNNNRVYSASNKPTPADIGAAASSHTHSYAASSHTHKYAGSSSAGGAATSANKVNANLVVKLNGGSTEGTNLFTFNGSAAKTVNITPSAIGAAASSHGTHVSYGGNGSATTVSRSDHTHSYAASSHTHTVLSVKSDNWKNASALPSTYDRGETLFFSNNPSSNKFNGLTYGMVQTLKEYGSGPAAWQFLYPYNAANDKFYVRNAQYNTDSWRSWAEVYTSLNKPTPAAIGAAAASHGTHLTIGTGASNAAAGNHTHKYAGSSSAGGAANSVKTNLIIKLNGGGTEGTNLFTFNGSTAKTINITPAAIGAAASSHGTHLIIGTGASNAAAGNHTHNYAGSSSAGGAATSANKVNKNLTIKLNGGSTEGTNLFTFNGSAAKTINITPSAIGAAASSHGTHLTIGTGSGNAAAGNHTHKYAGSSSAGGAATSANKVNTNLIIKLNSGSTEGTNLFTFNGSTAKTINITPSAIGAAASSHTHSYAASSHTHKYAGSSSAGGAATSANKVNASLVVKLNGGSTEGTNLFTFNGSAAKTINITPSAIGAAASSHTHSYAASSHTHSYLPLSGGTLTGTLNVNPDSIANATFASTYTTLRKPVTMSSDCTVSGSLIAPGGTTTSSIALTATNAYTEFQYGYGVIRVAEKNHLYLQAGHLVGETASEVRCTVYKKASEYTNLRAYNLCAQGAVYAQGTNISSDRTLKENIKYISNANTINDEEITIMDCYNFIKDDLGLATYNYINDPEKQQKIGFIAQDVLYDPIKQTDNKIGQLVITKLLGSEQLDPENPKLTYDVNNVLGVMLGAIQVTANKTAALEQENKELKELVNNLITRIEKLEQK